MQHVCVGECVGVCVCIYIEIVQKLNSNVVCNRAMWCLSRASHLKKATKRKEERKEETLLRGLSYYLHRFDYSPCTVSGVLGGESSK